MERRHRAFLIFVGLSTAAFLMLTLRRQLLNSDNFHLLWEATALLAGDHPYRDFFDWGEIGRAHV